MGRCGGPGRRIRWRRGCGDPGDFGTAGAPVSFARLLASGFGCGFAAVAPGTVGSLAALALGCALLAWWPTGLPLAALLAVLGGLWAVGSCEAGDDPGWVVIDEVAGMWIALVPLAWSTWPGTAGGAVAAFLLFRLLDIVKPGPVGWADRQSGPAAVMGDDVVAGTIAAAIVWAVGSRWPGVWEFWRMAG